MVELVGVRTRRRAPRADCTMGRGSDRGVCGAGLRRPVIVIHEYLSLLRHVCARFLCSAMLVRVLFVLLDSYSCVSFPAMPTTVISYHLYTGSTSQATRAGTVGQNSDSVLLTDRPVDELCEDESGYPTRSRRQNPVRFDIFLPSHPRLYTYGYPAVPKSFHYSFTFTQYIVQETEEIVHVAQPVVSDVSHFDRTPSHTPKPMARLR